MWIDKDKKISAVSFSLNSTCVGKLVKCSNEPSPLDRPQHPDEIYSRPRMLYINEKSALNFTFQHGSSHSSNDTIQIHPLEPVVSFENTLARARALPAAKTTDFVQ